MAAVGGIEGEYAGAHNPFMIQSVVQNLAQFLSFHELKLVRGLNHVWKEGIDKYFLKRCFPLTVTLGLEEKVNKVKSTQVISASRFLEIFSQPNHPHPLAQLLRGYRNFNVERLYSLKKKDEKEKAIREFYQFLTKVGPQMASLRLRCNWVLRNVQDSADILSCKYTPNLEELKLNEFKLADSRGRGRAFIGKRENKHFRILSITIDTHNHREFRELEVPWLDVLSCYPNLKTLKFVGVNPEPLQEIAAALVTLRKADETKLGLKELEFIGMRDLSYGYGTQWKQIRDDLCTANLPLETLFVDESVRKISPGLLQRYSGTLISFAAMREVPPGFPLMQALTEVSLYGPSDLNILTNVPNLKSFFLAPDDPIKYPKTSPSQIVAVTTFKSAAYRTWEVPVMTELFSQMPNIRVLEILLDNETFSWVCKQLPNLIELSVLGGDLDDSGIVGGNEGLLPNITNLKELQKFKMTGLGGNVYEASRMGVRLTDKSVFQGFSRMEKLSTLFLFIDYKLSADAMVALKRRIQNVEINVMKFWVPLAELK